MHETSDAQVIRSDAVRPTSLPVGSGARSPANILHPGFCASSPPGFHLHLHRLIIVHHRNLVFSWLASSSHHPNTIGLFFDAASSQHVRERPAHPCRCGESRAAHAQAMVLQDMVDWQVCDSGRSCSVHLLWCTIWYVQSYDDRPSCWLTIHLAGKTIAVNRAELCLTPACVHAASELLYNLSPNYKELDPCNNFEELVCGGK